mmetsp:Transcript_21529/g.53056  ORF Transcript_21529/g.53056 Transcript_21529/m.53056 type:complete len:237 (+) Transcript_21529:526-1236(+)
MGKILNDLTQVKEESVSVAATPSEQIVGHDLFAEMNMMIKMQKLEKEFLKSTRIRPSASVVETDELPPEDEDDDDEAAETQHLPIPTEMSNRAPRIRTRLYVTSESHIHSLLNVLRHCADDPADNRIIGPSGDALLAANSEYDYLTHIVFRMYENLAVPIEDEGRFRIELSFSPGAQGDPIQLAAENLMDAHHIPVLERQNLSDPGGVTLDAILGHLRTFAAPWGKSRVDAQSSMG